MVYSFIHTLCYHLILAVEVAIISVTRDELGEGNSPFYKQYVCAGQKLKFFELFWSKMGIDLNNFGLLEFVFVYLLLYHCTCLIRLFCLFLSY